MRLSQIYKNRILIYNPFQANLPFLYPLKTSKNSSLEGIEMEHWLEMC